MDRRLALKYLGVASAAAMILPSCAGDPKKVAIALNNLKINGDEEELVASIADVIIPATETPGARAVGAHHFAFVMVDDCQPSEVREKFLSGLRAFPEYVKTLTGKSFLKASVDEKLAILSEVDKKKEELPEDVKQFYSLSKNYIIQGYLTSQHFLTKVKQYQLVPGPHFKGCVALSEKKTVS